MPADGQAGMYRRATAAALVIAPLLFLIDNVLHPKEYARGNEAQQLEAIGDAYQRWQLSHFLGFLAIIGFTAAILGLAYLVRRKQATLGLIGGVLGVAGLVGLAGVIALDGFTWGVLGQVARRREADQGTVELALEEVQSSEWSLPFYLMSLAFLIGLVMLATGAARQGAVPWWAGGLLALGGLMVGSEVAIISNAYFIAGAAVLFAGGLAVALALTRMSDEAFARGAP